MSKNKKAALFLALICLIGVIAGFGSYMLNPSRHNKVYEESLGCDRITQDVRQTDYFCMRRDKFHSPETMTDEEIYSYYGCENYTGSQKDIAESIGCNDSKKLRQKLYNEVKSLRAKSRRLN